MYEYRIVTLLHKMTVMNIVMCILFCGVTAEWGAEFHIISIRACPSKRVIPCAINITNEHNKQYMSADIQLKVPLDDNIGINCRVEMSVDNKTFVHLFTIREKNFCLASNLYLKDLFFDFERAVQLEPGVCPIPQGRYYLHHYPLDFRKMALQLYPFGRIRMTTNAIDNRNSNNLVCIIVDAQNLPK